MIDMSKMNLIPINKMTGFIYNGEVYIDIFTSMHLLGFEKIGEDGNGVFLYSTMHKEFYSALHQLRINPDQYPIPMIQEPIKNKNGAISEYKIDLPPYVVESVLFKIAEKKRDKGITSYAIKIIVTKFKNLKKIVAIEYDNEMKKGHNYDPFKVEELQMNNSSPKITKCNIFGLELTGFVKNGIIYLNTKEAGFAIGITRKFGVDKFKIRWEDYYNYYVEASASLGDENLIGINLGLATNKRGFPSEYEKKMPEYITLMVVLGVANYLNSFKALNFKMEFLKNGLPFFLNNASDKDINSVGFLRNIKPLLDERERQLGIERQHQAIQQAQYMEIQYQNYIRNLYYFNQNAYVQGMRPIIPGRYNGQFSGMAYMMPSPKEIQKHLDSQPKHLKEVVRFEDPNKNK